jgi:hypothetical protein
MFFVGLVVSVVIALSRVNLETLRGQIAHALSHSAGMPVEIRGDVAWKFSLTPRVALSDVAIKAPDWAKNKDSVSIKLVVAKLNIFSLLSQTAAVSDLELSDPVVYLEKDNAGEYSISSSWHSDTSESEKDAPEKFPFDSDWGIDSIRMKNPVFVFIDAGKQSKFNADEILLRYKKTRKFIEYSGQISVDKQDYPFIISLSELNATRKVYPIRIAIANKLSPITANVALEQTSRLPIDFIVRGKLADAHDLVAKFIPDFPALAPMEINLLGGMEHNEISLRQSSIIMGDNDLTISGTYSWADKKPKITTSIKSKRFVLGEVFPELYGGVGVPWKRPDRPLNVFKNTPLYSHYLNLMNADIALDFERLVVYRNLSVNEIKANANIKDGALSVDADSKFAGGRIQAALRAADDNGSLRARGAGRGKGVIAGRILHSIGEKNLLSGLPLDFEFYLQGHGWDLSGLMATITGPIQVRSSGGGMALPDMAEYLYGQDFLTSLRHGVQDMITERDKYDKVAISCAVVNLKLRSGRTETERGVALQTNAVNMRAAGFVDLATETLGASLVSTPVRGLKLSITGNVVNAMEFKGNLAEPDMNFNGGSMLERTAVTTGLGMLVLAPFTGGLSLIAGAGVGFLAGDLLNNWLADDHPCETAIKSGAPTRDDDPKFFHMPLPELVSEFIK